MGGAHHRRHGEHDAVHARPFDGALDLRLRPAMRAAHERQRRLRRAAGERHVDVDRVAQPIEPDVTMRRVVVAAAGPDDAKAEMLGEIGVRRSGGDAHSEDLADPAADGLDRDREVREPVAPGALIGNRAMRGVGRDDVVIAIDREAGGHRAARRRRCAAPGGPGCPRPDGRGPRARGTARPRTRHRPTDGRRRGCRPGRAARRERPRTSRPPRRTSPARRRSSSTSTREAIGASILPKALS